VLIFCADDQLGPLPMEEVIDEDIVNDGNVVNLSSKVFISFQNPNTRLANIFVQMISLIYCLWKE